MLCRFAAFHYTCAAWLMAELARLEKDDMLPFFDELSADGAQNPGVVSVGDDLHG